MERKIDYTKLLERLLQKGLINTTDVQNTTTSGGTYIKDIIQQALHKRLIRKHNVKIVSPVKNRKKTRCVYSITKQGIKYIGWRKK